MARPDFARQQGSLQTTGVSREVVSFLGEAIRALDSASNQLQGASAHHAKRQMPFRQRPVEGVRHELSATLVRLREVQHQALRPSFVAGRAAPPSSVQ